MQVIDGQVSVKEHSAGHLPAASVTPVIMFTYKSTNSLAFPRSHVFLGKVRIGTAAIGNYKDDAILCFVLFSLYIHIPIKEQNHLM